LTFTSGNRTLRQIGHVMETFVNGGTTLGTIRRASKPSAVLLCGCLVLACALAWAQPLTHTVREGDTLWDICEKYYGDPDLWPKLWQMNPFVTNPHLLKPGDVITLLEGVPLKKEAVREEAAPAVEEKAPAPRERPAGIDLQGFTNVKALGYLSREPVTPWGTLFSTVDEKIMLSRGDAVFIKFGTDHEAGEGQAFSIYSVSELLTHPVTGEDLGYAVSLLGKVVLEKKVERSVWKAVVEECYTSIRVGDPVMPHETPPPSCILPVSSEKPVSGVILAAHEEKELIGQFTGVYLDAGYEAGVQRGNVFEIVRRKQVESRKGWFSKEKTTLPDVVLGYLVVLDARKDTATAVVIASRQDLYKGAYIKALQWSGARPAVLSMLPACPAP